MDIQLPNSLPDYSKENHFTQDQVNLINKLFTEITLDLNLDSVLQKSVDQIVSSLSLLGALIFLRDSASPFVYTKTISQSTQSKVALQLLNLGKMKDSLKIQISQKENLIVDTIANNRINSSTQLKKFTKGVLSDTLVDLIQKTTQTGDIISIPLLAQNEVIGAIMFTRKQVNQGFTDILPLLVLYASQVAIAIRISQVFEKTHEETIKLKSELQKYNLLGQQSNLENIVKTTPSLPSLNMEVGKKIVEKIDDAKLLLEKSISNPFSQASGLNPEQVTEMYTIVGGLQKSLYEFFGFKMADLTSMVTQNYIPEKLFSMVKEVYEKAAIKAKEKNIEIKIEYPENLKEEAFKANRIEFIVALNIIVDNSIQYSKTGPILISVSKNARFLEIAIKDNGVGIPIEEQSNLFKPHFESAIGKSMNPNGNRLGLFTAKQVFDKHNAGIVIDSKPGSGTTVFVLIPVGNT